MGDFKRIQKSRRGLLQLQDDEVFESPARSVPRIRSYEAASVRPNAAVYPSQGAVEGAQLLGGLVSKANQLLDSLVQAGKLAGEHCALVQKPLQVRRGLAHGRGS